MNAFERLAIKLWWKRLEGRMAGLRRWAPLIGVAVLVATVLLRFVGQDEVAKTLEQIGGATGLNEQSPVGYGELAAAFAAGVGVCLKVRSEWRKARSLKP